ncbi:hypothetical protein AK88_03343 [Plasmodium fragile]|uniref:Schizont-infected cell agglutination extracellular alpha domain-containing protein n=1 Tax=Plasmodium fragile TaxID=5857 RepID=A0A0D9QJR9_PLAFR|nr:uncharacterized protein AK88_03343 [Plasmodium fragile]KJP87057.1 hypothetical protein AK88_03343 [Plasmodium fragile]
MAHSEPGVADFTQHLRKWFERRNMWNEEQHNSAIWNDIEQLFQVLAGSIKRTDQFNTDVCKTAFPRWTLRNNMAQFVVCRRIVNIFLFMDGIDMVQEKWDRKGIFQGDEEFEQYVRCMLGNVAMAELFKNNCSAGEIIGAVSTGMHMWRGLSGHEDGSKICRDINYGSLMIGSKFVAATMAGWIRNWSIKNGAGRLAATGTGVCKKENKNPEEGTEVPAVRMFQEEDNIVIRELVKEGVDMETEKKKQMLKELEQ